MSAWKNSHHRYLLVYRGHAVSIWFECLENVDLRFTSFSLASLKGLLLRFSISPTLSSCFHPLAYAAENMLLVPKQH
ncbi:hypothetical protein NQZ68_023159 [Dissostichus eleginoides]|nr:hypothetical protein NQZ68_023159 [Dissostichus eleginoides]